MASRSTKRRWRMSPQVRRVGGGGRGGDAPLPRPRDGALPAARRRAGLPPAGGRENLDASHARDMREMWACRRQVEAEFESDEAAAAWVVAQVEELTRSSRAFCKREVEITQQGLLVEGRSL